MTRAPKIAIVLTGLAALLATGTAPVIPAQGPGLAQAGGFTPAELRALVDRVAANQHRDDDALDLYERVERHTKRPNPGDKTPGEDKTWRVIPTGTGTVRVQIEQEGKPVDASLYHKQLQDAAQALENSNSPNLPQQRRDEAKYARRKRERYDLVEAAKGAFIFTFLGREQRNGRTLTKFSAEPNPIYKATSRNTSFFAHAHGIAWVDESAGQVVRIEAEIIKDISIGGGILGKIYRGGRFVLEQTEVVPDVWVPTLYQYDVDGRKFLFGFDVHETIEASHYRRIGPPREALAAIRRELSSGNSTLPARSDP